MNTVQNLIASTSLLLYCELAEVPSAALDRMVFKKSFLIWITGPKTRSIPNKTGLPYNFCLIKFLHSGMVEAVDAPTPG